MTHPLRRTPAQRQARYKAEFDALTEGLEPLPPSAPTSDEKAARGRLSSPLEEPPPEVWPRHPHYGRWRFD